MEPAEGELTGALTRSVEGMAVRQPTMLRGGPVDAARLRGCSWTSPERKNV
jgi:hypothetical protein